MERELGAFFPRRALLILAPGKTRRLPSPGGPVGAVPQPDDPGATGQPHPFLSKPRRRRCAPGALGLRFGHAAVPPPPRFARVAWRRGRLGLRVLPVLRCVDEVALMGRVARVAARLGARDGEAAAALRRLARPRRGRGGRAFRGSALVGGARAKDGGGVAVGAERGPGGRRRESRLLGPGRALGFRPLLWPGPAASRATIDKFFGRRKRGGSSLASASASSVHDWSNRNNGELHLH